MKEDDKFREILGKARQLCGRQEKCSADISARLSAWGLSGPETERAVQVLKKEGFVDDRRYALAFARDKYRLGRWGRIRIGHALRMKKIDGDLIEEALREIDDDDYPERVFLDLRKKMKSLQGKSRIELKSRLYRYAAGRGYESSVIYDAINRLFGER